MSAEGLLECHPERHLVLLGVGVTVVLVANTGKSNAALLLVEHARLLWPGREQEDGNDADDRGDNTFPKEDLAPAPHGAHIVAGQETTREQTPEGTRERGREGQEKADSRNEFLSGVVSAEEEGDTRKHASFEDTEKDSGDKEASFVVNERCAD